MTEADLGPIKERLHARLADLYGGELATQMSKILTVFCQNYRQKHLFARRQPELTERDTMLSAFGNQIIAQRTPGFQVLHRFLRQQVGYRVSMLHVQPFYPAGDEIGHAVTNHLQVRPDLGGWDDVKSLAGDFSLMVDGVVNHVSDQNPIYISYTQGSQDYADYFLEVPDGVDLSAVSHDYSHHVLVDTKVGTETRKIWSTHGEGYADLNYANPNVLMDMIEVLLFLADKGVGMIRLRDIPYLWKEPGTSCVNLPNTHAIIQIFRAVFDLAAPHVLLVGDAQTDAESVASYVGNGRNEAHIVLNAGLPAMLLYSVVNSDASKLTAWAEALPELPGSATYINTAALSERIDLRPVLDVFTADELSQFTRTLSKRMGRYMMRSGDSDDQIPRDISVHYFDAVNDPDDDDPIDDQIARFMLTQALPMCLQGIPAIYLHSLLGARKEGESITQIGQMGTMHFTHAIIHEVQLQRALADVRSMRYRVFEEFLRLLEVRGSCSAFHPHASQQILRVGDSAFCVRRHNAKTGEQVLCLHNFRSTWGVIEARHLGESGRLVDLIDDSQFIIEEGSMVPLTPYRVRWLKLA